MLRESFVQRGKDEGSDFLHLRSIGQPSALGRHGDRQLSIENLAILWVDVVTKPGQRKQRTLSFRVLSTGI